MKLIAGRYYHSVSGKYRDDIYCLVYDDGTQYILEWFQKDTEKGLKLYFKSKENYKDHLSYTDKTITTMELYNPKVINRTVRLA